MKVFYTAAAVAPTPEGFAVTLDGKPLKTPGKRPMVMESLPLAEAIAAEWQAQEDEIKPASMQLMKLAATAMDRRAIWVLRPCSRYQALMARTNTDPTT